MLLHQVRDEDRGRFETFVDWLQEAYEVVSYSDAVDSLDNPATDRPTAAISFDDGVKNNLNAAMILEDRGISACFFVCPSIIGHENQRAIDRYCRERMLFDESVPFMNWEDLELLLSAGHELGNHSKHHFYMMELEDDEFVEEVLTGKEELDSRFGAIKHFAWPYGRFFHFRRERVKTVIELGHETCASGERGSHQVNLHRLPYCLRRDSIDIRWPLRHIQTLIKRSSRSPISPDNSWPV